MLFNCLFVLLGVYVKKTKKFKPLVVSTAPPSGRDIYKTCSTWWNKSAMSSIRRLPWKFKVFEVDLCCSITSSCTRSSFFSTVQLFWSFIFLLFFLCLQLNNYLTFFGCWWWWYHNPPLTHPVRRSRRHRYPLILRTCVFPCVDVYWLSDLNLSKRKYWNIFPEVLEPWSVAAFRTQSYLSCHHPQPRQTV